MLFMNLTIISNPQSGYNRRKGMEKFTALAVNADVPHVNATTSEEMAQALQTLSKHAPEVLAINGGDGSVDMAITLMRNQNIFKKEPALVLFKGGTTNLIHRNVGLRGAPHKAFKDMLNTNMKTEKLCPLEIRRVGQKDAPLHGFFVGIGAIPRVTFKTRETLHRQGFSGPLSESFMLAKVLLRLKYRHDLSTDDLLKPSPVICNNHQNDYINFHGY